MNIREILEKAYQKKASDIHIIPGCPVMFRINGQMCAQEEICTEKTDIEHFLQELLTKEQFVTLEQEGEIDTAGIFPPDTICMLVKKRKVCILWCRIADTCEVIYDNDPCSYTSHKIETVNSFFSHKNKTPLNRSFNRFSL